MFDGDKYMRYLKRYLLVYAMKLPAAQRSCRKVAGLVTCLKRLGCNFPRYLNTKPAQRIPFFSKRLVPVLIPKRK